MLSNLVKRLDYLDSQTVQPYPIIAELLQNLGFLLSTQLIALAEIK